MLIKDIFERPIERDIDTVIVAGQAREEKIYQELDEYVVTDELLGHFKHFFDIYSYSIDNPMNDIGVWISGFYGSGKSHFLKILSYILMNKEINGNKPADFFIGKKINDESLIENINKVLNVKNDVVLFNVASKASPRDTIIDVFFKVFNELRGYSNKFLNIEKALDEEGKFEEFKRLFETYEGKSWESKRQNLVKLESLKRSLIEVGFTKDEDFNFLYNTIDYDFTPENLAKEVNEYCKKNNTHVLFFIDEIGQFISEYSDLMLELQSIVEELANECYGKSWVIVTSQDTLLDMTNDKENDFSKIQARFDTRLPLSSSQVDEIIKLRLLDKNNEAKSCLKSDYKKYGSSLKNVLTFVESSEMKNYSNSEDYIDNYPIIPYQFKLLQESLIQLRENSASGAGVGHGARSMIQIIHETIKDNGENSTKSLIPFHMFYNHIKVLINQEHVRVINNAMDNDNLNDFDINVLKTLFLIKYVSDSFLKPNIENIATLMISNVDDDIISIQEQVTSSLNRLIKEVFVNKKRDKYYYLTTKQQEVNKEISSIFIDDNEKTRFLLTYIKDIFKDSFPNKFEYKNNYNFSIDVDLDNLDNINKDLGLSFLSSSFEDSDSLDEYYLKNMSSNKNFAILRLPDDYTLFDEIEGILQIKDYLKDKNINSSEQVECEKQEELNDREKRIRNLIENYIHDSSIYIWGEKVIINGNSTKNFFKELLNSLFERVYYNFNHCPESTKEDIFNALKFGDQESLIESENQYNALYDLIEYIRSYDNVNINQIFDKYKKAPYGFKDEDISFLLAKLFSQKKISLILNDEEIFIKDDNHQKIFNYITMKSPVESKKLFVSYREEIGPKMKKAVKNCFNELSNGQALNGLESLMSSFKDNLKEKIKKIDFILDEVKRDDRYPGKNDLKEGKIFFEEIMDKSTLKSFYNHVSENEEQFIIVLDNLRNIFEFYDSVQKEIFTEALSKIENYEDNGIYVDIESINEIIGNIKGIVEMDSPYSNVQKLKQLNEEYDVELTSLIKSHKEPVLQKIDNDYGYLMNLIEEANLKSNDKDQFEDIISYKYERLKEKIQKSEIISFILGKKEESTKIKKNYIKEINYLIKEGIESESLIDLSDIIIDEVSVRNSEEIQEVLELIKSRIEEELKENDVVRIK